MAPTRILATEILPIEARMTASALGGIIMASPPDAMIGPMIILLE